MTQTQYERYDAIADRFFKSTRFLTSNELIYYVDLPSSKRLVAGKSADDIILRVVHFLVPLSYDEGAHALLVTKELRPIVQDLVDLYTEVWSK